jgi:hypothetical protein
VTDGAAGPPRSATTLAAPAGRRNRADLLAKDFAGALVDVANRAIVDYSVMGAVR